MANNENSREQRFINIYLALIKNSQRKIIDYIKLLQRPQGGTGLQPARAAGALRPSTDTDTDFDLVNGVDNTFNGEKTTKRRSPGKKSNERYHSQTNTSSSNKSL
jgi:hypothetical protein